MENDLHRDGPDEAPERPTAQQAREALDRLDRDGALLSARVVTPWWYHPALGLIVALFAGGQALPGAVSLWMVAFGIIAIPVLTLTYNSRYGVSISKPTGPRSRRLFLLTFGVLIAAMAGGLTIKVSGADLWWALLPAVIAFGATVVLGRRYDDALRQEIAGATGDRP